ncbi:hypothetical protein [Methylosarcina fibrata]|uniref:hypothetical protein n=1 Tax=Methylosarcina fibrata TaxID=105972 RepID=UPI0003A56039|nr:hypothetical protein [Methylosarcina fibrata]
MRQINDYCLSLLSILVRALSGGADVSMVSFKKLLRELFMFLVILHPSELLLADELKPKVLDSSGKASSLSQETIREIFFMRLSSWPDGSPIRVFVLPDNNPIHVQFAKEVLGVYPFQLRSAWDRLVYSGTGVAPTTVETQEEMKARIERTPGGIGYIGK